MLYIVQKRLVKVIFYIVMNKKIYKDSKDYNFVVKN